MNKDNNGVYKYLVKTVRFFDKKINDDDNSKYQYKYQCYGMDDFVKENNRLELNFNGLADTICMFEIDYDLDTTTLIDVYLNDVKIYSEEPNGDKIELHASIDFQNKLTIVLDDTANLNDIRIIIYGRVIIAGKKYPIRIIDNSGGFCVIKYNDPIKISATLEDINLKIFGSDFDGKSYAKNSILDYCYLYDDLGDKNQEVLLKNDNGIYLQNLTTGEENYLIESAELGCICEAKYSRFRVVLIRDNAINVYQRNSEGKIDNLSKMLKVYGKIIKIHSIHTENSNLHGFVIVTDLNNGYIVLFDESDNMYVYESLNNLYDCEAYLYGDIMYLCIKNKHRNICIKSYDFAMGKMKDKKVMNTKQYYNLDYIYIKNNFVYLINGDLISKNAIESCL